MNSEPSLRYTGTVTIQAEGQAPQRAAARLHNQRGNCRALAGEHARAYTDYERALELDPDNRAVRGTLAYAAAATDDFPEALEHLRAYLAIDGRRTAMRMGLGLLEAGILHYQGQEEAANERLSDYALRTRDPWFLTVCAYLRGQQTEEGLRGQAGDSPENILTGFTAAGFRAEGSKEKKNAIRFYREALGSFLDNWVEYDFVRERVNRLKRSGD